MKSSPSEKSWPFWRRRTIELTLIAKKWSNFPVKWSNSKAAAFQMCWGIFNETILMRERSANSKTKWNIFILFFNLPNVFVCLFLLFNCYTFCIWNEKKGASSLKAVVTLCPFALIFFHHTQITRMRKKVFAVLWWKLAAFFCVTKENFVYGAVKAFWEQLCKAFWMSCEKEFSLLSELERSACLTNQIKSK